MVREGGKGRERECVSVILICTFKVGGMRQGGGKDLIPLSDNFCIMVMLFLPPILSPFPQGSAFPVKKVASITPLVIITE